MLTFLFIYILGLFFVFVCGVIGYGFGFKYILYSIVLAIIWPVIVIWSTIAVLIVQNRKNKHDTEE